MHRFWRRMVEWIRGARTERDISDELDSHLAHLADEFRRRGFDPAEARRRALLELGGLERARELVRDQRGFRPLDDLLRDVRYAVRLLVRAPGFTATVVVTLALGIGANTAIFSLVDAVVIRPLPYPDAARLASIWEHVQGPGEGAAAPERIAVAPANLVDYEARARSFAAMTAFAQTALNLTGVDAPRRLAGQTVSVRYFDVLGVRPAVGRAFSAADFTWGSHRVVILSNGLWRSTFGADPAIVGRTLQLNLLSYEVVGIMPPGFVAPIEHNAVEPVDLLIPLVYGPGDDVMTNRRDHRVDVIARRRNGVSFAAAAQELRSISDAMRREFPEIAGTTVGLAPLRADQVRDVRAQMIGLLVASGLVLFIACVNVAGLVMVRSLGARREVAIRAALGASRGRLVRSLLTQSVVLASTGGAAGLAVAFWTRDLLVSLAPASLPYAASAALDVRVMAFSGLLAIATGLLFGMLPAWQVGRARPNEALRSSERVVAARWMVRSRNVLVVAQIAVSMVLLVCAGLMVRSLVALNRVDLGFEADDVLAANVALPDAAYPNRSAKLAFFEEVEARLRAVPGVRGVAFATGLPMRGSWSSGFELERPAATSGATSGGAPMLAAGFQAVSPGFFDTIGIRLVHGRGLSAADRSGREPVAVVSEAFGREFLGGADPIGQRFRRAPRFPWIRIVGVTRDIRRGGRAAEIAPQVYLAAAQTELYPNILSRVAVKVAGRADPVRDALHKTIWSIDADQPLTSVMTLDETLALGQAERRFQTFLFGLFAIVALVLCVIGIYGVVAYAVSQRTAEIGLRLALGASPPRIVRWMVGQAGWLLLAGAAAGLVLAVGLARLISSLLFGVTSVDGPTYLMAALVLAAVALVAAWLAARRATRIDPIAALR